VDEVKYYANLANSIKTAFNKEWFDPKTHHYATGSQTANLFPLALGIIPPAQENGVVRNIVRSISDTYKGHLHTGNTGTTCMIDTLTEQGQGETLHDVVAQTTYPGWGYMVAQGATTIWENWGLVGDAESMVMWLTVDEFFYNDLAGIKGPDYLGPGFMQPGFAQLEIQPRILGDLTHANASFRTVRGMVSSSWRRTGRSLTLDVLIPVNSQARVAVPKLNWNKVRVSEGGAIIWDASQFLPGQSGITGAVEQGDYVNFNVGSGGYSFVVSRAP
jgi:alpha-L-rhamnosidase